MILTKTEQANIFKCLQPSLEFIIYYLYKIIIYTIIYQSFLYIKYLCLFWNQSELMPKFPTQPFYLNQLLNFIDLSHAD